ncbi:hypothetical protein F4778DRAFT_735109 [Xylariomycetidae sp. FL2044]|nr:hypothetical protein F4778DRAFT_735109 [Xylariomycetidae sp. FL2044]
MPPMTRRKAKAVQEATGEDPSASQVSDAVEISHTSIEVPIPAIHSKRKSSTASRVGGMEHESHPSEAATPKRQRLAVRTRKEKLPKGGKKTEIEVQIPSSAVQRSQFDSIPDSQSEAGDSESDAPEPTSATKQLQEEASQNLTPQSAEPKPAPQPEPTPKPKSTHVVFGEDDDVDNYAAAVAEQDQVSKQEEDNGKNEDGENESDSDDEAPEAVSTTTAAKESMRTAKVAAEAANKQVAELKRKRQERDNMLKDQARKRVRERKDKAPEPKRRDEGKEDGDEPAADGDVATARRRPRKFDLPDMLPAEFLTDSSDESEDESALKAVKKSKKITFEDAMQGLGHEGKRPRDEIVGTTRYRVLAEQGDQNLAPKMNKNARYVKESLLKRNRVGVQPNKRKGFFVR